MKKVTLVFIFFLILLLPISFGFHLWFGKKSLEKTRDWLLAGDFNQALKTATESEQILARLKNYFSLLPFLAKIGQIEDWVEIGDSLSATALHLAKTGQYLEQIGNVVLAQEKGDLKETTAKVKAELDLVWRETALLEGLLKKKPLLVLPQMGDKIKMAQDLIAVIPQITAVGEKRAYLLLFQNNMELRATGGFIGSYGLLIFQDGQIIDFQVQDVYAADGQLKGHVEPPEAIKKYLGEASWFLRDSNFSPDFPTSAHQASWFFQKEIGRKVDGVIALNLFVAQKILAAVGGVKLADYQETITADNLFERAEYYSEVGFFPGSTQKKDFLGNVAGQIFQKLKEKKERLKIAQAIWESLEEKQMLVFLEDKESQAVFQKYNWSGAVREASGYLMLVESNFGVNKANFFLKRKVNWGVVLGEQTEEKLTIHYQNNSPTQSWPGGKYKNYLRVYTSTNSRLTELRINDQIIGANQIEIFSDSGKTVFAFLVEVPAGEEKKVSLKYFTPITTKDFSSGYSLLFQKQSGVGNDPLSIMISYPGNLDLVRVTPQALTGPQAILYNTDLSQDRFLLVEFRP